MKREFNPGYVALFLVFGCALFRIIAGHHPEALPGVTPFLAAAYVGGLCLPRRWAWLIGPAAFVLSEFAFLGINQQNTGSMFTWSVVSSVAIYAGVGLLGIVIARHPSLLKIIGGCVAGTILFYVAANTVAWWENVALQLAPTYPSSFAGWVQANTTGIPGYVPAWTFLRNGLMGDLGFTLLFLLVLDRSLVFGSAPARAVARAA
jgi:hypothetical protein